MKLKVTGLKKEMSTTGTGASFTPGTGGQYATSKAFKKKTDEIGEPFEIPNPSVPNRKSKFIDYKQLFEDAIEELETEKTSLSEARYSQFKSDTKLRTPTEQIHRAVREIRRKIDEIVKVVGHTERMKAELKQSNEGMSYLKRTRNSINTISEKLQDLNNRIKGLTE